MRYFTNERPFGHGGRTGEVVGIALQNLLLNVLTLSFWRFWGKTRVRRVLWGNTTAWGDPVEYTGTGRELFLGFLIAFFGVLAPVILALGTLQALVEAGQVWPVPLILVLQLALAVLAGAGLYRARRYQLSRTLWRGIRAGLGGKAWQYGCLFLATSVVTVLSLGWALPWSQMTLASYALENTTFGNRRFSCTAVARPLYKRFAVAWLVGAVAGPAALGFIIVPLISTLQQQQLDPGAVVLTLLAGLAAMLLLGPLLLLPYAWYRAAFYAQLAEGTRFDGTRFAFDVRSWDLVWLVFNNMLISLLSLGILKPWAALRTFRFACNHLMVFGQPDFDSIRQGAAATSRTGEGLAAVLDGAGEF